ncbi:MAG: hypothetical protein HFH68_12495 [Lachnospiraceae bacterium]|nr:hypothetical protein [Lachnospiraceae bacterium]
MGRQKETRRNNELEYEINKDVYKNFTVIELFEQQVKQHPYKIAVNIGNNNMTLKCEDREFNYLNGGF